jgi:predicted negative regulator of RcsB-dependent stress response
MDAKERHELKDNDLAEFLENFGAFWDKHGTKITMVILAFVVVWFGTRYYSSTQANRQENAWADLASTSTPQGYRERAKENAGYAGVSNLALLRGAEAYHTQAVKLGLEEVDPESGLMSAEDSLDNAEAMYKQVLESDADPVFRANAAVGLANVAETSNDFEAADVYWTQADSIAKDANLNAISAQAQVRLSLLDELAKPIIFADPLESPAPALETDTPTDTEADTTEAPATGDVVAPADPG